MRKTRIFGLIFIIFGLFSLIITNLMDLFRGKTYQIGPSQIVASVICFGFIVLGSSMIRNGEQIICLFRCLSRYVIDQKYQLCQAVSKKSFLLFLSMFVILVLVILQYYAFGLQMVKDFPDDIGAGATSTMVQVYIAIGIGILCSIPLFFCKSRKIRKIIDVLIGMSLFILAVRMWTSLPIIDNFFMRHIDTTTMYPFSDSRSMDTSALAFLQGQGIAYGKPAPHTLYVFFLALMHVFFGENYASIMNAHVIVFSIIPVLIYFLGKRIGSRAIGGTASIIIIFHEYNQIVLSSITTLVSVQMIMTEVFTEVLVIVCVILTFKWFSNILSEKYAALTGLVFGLIVLTRTQALTFLIIYLLFFLYRLLVHKEKLIKQGIIFICAFFAVITPWMTRNLVHNGSFSLDDPKVIYAIVTINGNNSVGGTGLDGQNLFREVSNRIITEGGFYSLRTFEFASNSILNSLFQLPFTLRSYGLKEYVNNILAGYSLPYSSLTGGQLFCLFLQMAIVLFGVTITERRLGFTGLFPFFIYLFYVFSSAIFGYTGFRFNQPVDWIILLYWASGVVGIISVIIPGKLLYINEISFEKTIRQNRLSPILGLIIFAIGIAFPSSELILRKSSSTLTSAMLPQKLTGAELSIVSTSEDNQVVYYKNGFLGESGRAFYPVLFTNEKQWKYLRNNGIHYRYSDYYFLWSNGFIDEQIENKNKVLYFTLSADNVKDVLLYNPEILTQGVSEDAPVNNSEVFIYGCDRGKYIEAYYLHVNTGSLVYEIKAGSEEIPEVCSSQD